MEENEETVWQDAMYNRFQGTVLGTMPRSRWFVPLVIVAFYGPLAVGFPITMASKQYYPVLLAVAVTMVTMGFAMSYARGHTGPLPRRLLAAYSEPTGWVETEDLSPVPGYVNCFRTKAGVTIRVRREGGSAPQFTRIDEFAERRAAAETLVRSGRIEEDRVLVNGKVNDWRIA